MENREYVHEFVPKISDNILDDQNFDPDIDKNEIRFSVLPQEALSKITKQKALFDDFAN